MNIIGTRIHNKYNASYIISTPLGNERGEFVLVGEKSGRRYDDYTLADYNDFIRRGWWIPEQIDLQPLIYS